MNVQAQTRRQAGTSCRTATSAHPLSTGSRSATSCAVEDQLITQNPAAVIRLNNRREPRRKRQSWTVDEARRFLENARRDDDVFYPAYVLILVLGLRKGELLGLAWGRVSLDEAELHIVEQLQRQGWRAQDHRARRAENMRLAAGRTRRPSPRGHADPAA